MPACAVKSCKNIFTTEKKLQGITFHQFPVAKELKDKWTAAIQRSRNDPQWWPSDKSVVCSAHFEEKDLYLTIKGYHRVRRSAYPKKMLTPCFCDNNPTLPNDPLTLITVPGVPDPPDLSSATDVKLRIKPDPDASQPADINTGLSYAPQDIVVEIEPLCFDTNNINTSPSTSSSVYHHQINTNEANLPSFSSEDDISFMQTDQVPIVSSGPVPSCFMTACPKCSHHFWVTASVTQQPGCQEKISKLSTERVMNMLPPTLPSASYKEVAVETATAAAAARAAAAAALPSTSASVPIVSVKAEPREPIEPREPVEPPEPTDDEEDMPNLDTLTTNYKLTQKLQSKNRTIEENRTKIRTLQQKVRRLQSRNKSLKDVVTNTKHRDDIAVVDNIFKNLDRKKLKKNLKYSPDVRRFCITLNTHYPKAYEYVRNNFNSCLPHPKTLGKWKSRKDEPELQEEFQEENLEFLEENLQFAEDIQDSE